MGLTCAEFEAITQLHARYCHTIDLQDGEGLLACFAPGAVFDGHEEFHQGERELRSFAADVGRRTQGHVRHTILYSLIDGDGTTARSVSYAAMTRDYGRQSGRGQVTHSAMFATGVYADDLVKAGGEWRYAKRRFRFDATPHVGEIVGTPLAIGHVDAGAAAGALSPLDQEAIRQLLGRYAYTLDFRDHDGFVDCFTPDGSFAAVSLPDQGGRLRFQGHEELREFARAVSEYGAGHARHAALGAVIQGDGERASVSSYGFNPQDYLYGFVALGDEYAERHNVTVGNTGIYRDAVVKVEGRWRFSERTFRYDGWPDVIALANKPLELDVFA